LAIFLFISLNEEIKTIILQKQNFCFQIWKIFDEIDDLKIFTLNLEKKRFGIIKLFVVMILLSLGNDNNLKIEGFFFF
jgi:hypothetical protein